MLGIGKRGQESSCFHYVLRACSTSRSIAHLLGFRNNPTRVCCYVFTSSPKPTLKRDADDRSYSYEASWPHHSIFLGICLKVGSSERRSQVLSVQAIGLLIGMKDRLSVDKQATFLSALLVPLWTDIVFHVLSFNL
jgi:hypothetical protein